MHPRHSVRAASHKDPGPALPVGFRTRTGRPSPTRRGLSQLLANDLPNGFEDRPLMQMRDKRVVDQGLVVASSSLICKLAKSLDHLIVQADGNLCLARLGLHYGSSL